MKDVKTDSYNSRACSVELEQRKVWNSVNKRLRSVQNNSWDKDTKINIYES